MDIKLKNRHKLGIWLVFALILAVSVATVRLYPYMQSRAGSYHETSSQAMEDKLGTLDKLVGKMMTTSYVAYWESLQEREEKALTASQVFLPGLEEMMYQALKEDNDIFMGETVDVGGPRYTGNHYQNLQETMDHMGREWKQEYHQYSPVLHYQLLDRQGQEIRSNVKNPASFFASELQPDEIQVVLAFQSSGSCKGAELEGEGCDLENLRLSIEAYEFYDPLETKAESGYLYSGVHFTGPKDYQVRFRCSPEAFSNLSLELADKRGAGLEINDYWLSGGYPTVILIMSILLALAALLLPGVKSLGLGNSPWCRLALEPLIGIAFVWGLVIMGNGWPVKLIMMDLDGSLVAEFVKAEFQPAAASGLALLVNVGFWAAMYSVLYWMVLCIRPLFLMGVGRYLAERSWIGRGIARLSGLLRQSLTVLNKTDWSENSNKIIRNIVIVNFVVLSLITVLWMGGILLLVVYSLLLFAILKKYNDRLKDAYHTLVNAVGRIAAGELDVEITEDFGIFNPLKEQLLKIQTGLQHAVAQEVKSERTKAELITNVSHDLKTPLTAIITYVNLLKNDNLTKEERDSYIEILDRKSMRLKSLIEDLFEVTKASSGSISLHLTDVDVVSLLKQVRLELSDKIGESEIEFRLQLPKEKVILRLDGQKTYRVFENLMVNILKYAMPKTRAYLEIKPEETGVTVSMRNISARELHVSPEELTERFVRGDESRNTDGSGLGLAIARGFVEAQGGTMNILVEDDVFKVVIFWRYPEEDQNGSE